MKGGVTVLNQTILQEIKGINLSGITITDVYCQPNLTEVTFLMPPATVKFIVDATYQFQVTEVNYGDTIYNDLQHLTHFNSVVLHILEQTKLVDIRQRLEMVVPVATPQPVQSTSMPQSTMPGVDQNRLNALLAREKRVRDFEQQLDLKEEEIKRQEQILYEKEKVIIEQRTLEEEKAKEKRSERIKKVGGVLSRKKTNDG